MKKLLLSCAAAFALAGAGVAALGQVNVVPQIGLITSVLKQPTYSAVSLALVPASSATDIFCIGGSTTKNIHVTRLEISGTAGTLITLPVTLLLRHSLDTGGTIALTTANPNNTDGPNSPADAASTATLVAYTANPTINDSSPTYLRTGTISLPTTSANIAPPPLVWQFSGQVDFFDKGADIIKATTVVQQYCLNFNATTVSTGSLQIDAEWTEQ